MSEQVAVQEKSLPAKPFEATIDLFDLNDKICSPDEPEFLDKFIVAVQERLDAYQIGAAADEMVFSGIDGAYFRKAGKLHEEDTVFGMNITGWKGALESGIYNPGHYAMLGEVPCIAVYDGRQLLHAYAAVEMDTDGERGGRARLHDVETGDPITPDFHQTEAVVHKDYPNKIPRDVLVGVFFIQEI